MLAMVERIRAWSRGVAAPVLAAAGCALGLAVTGCGGSSRAAAAMPPSAGALYTLMQMNLCLSGLAGCYAKVEYPAGTQDVVARIREAHPDAVTLNETCSGDVALIARQTGYHLRFSRVIYHDTRFACVKPRGRGIFGDAVLTKAAIVDSNSRPFESQAARAACVGVRRHACRRRCVRCSPRLSGERRSGRERPAMRRAQGAPRPPRGRPYRHLRRRCQPPLFLRPSWLLDPNRPCGPPRPREPARLRNRFAPLPVGTGAGGGAY